MELITPITSTKNDRIKALQRLEKSSERKETGTFLVEGIREISKAVKAGFTFREVFYCPTLVSEDAVRKLIGSNTVLVPVSHHVFEALTYRENKDGLLAVAQYKSLSLDAVQLSKTPFLIVLEAVEKPGNLGAILRTADAANVDAVLVCDPKTDIYNPNVIRSSIGCVFSKQVVCCDNESAVHYLRQKQITSIATTPYTEQVYFKEDLTKPVAIVMGTEAEGLSDFWLQHADVQAKVPMLGEADSLNVSVCLAVLVYETVRQRLSLS